MAKVQSLLKLSQGDLRRHEDELWLELQLDRLLIKLRSSLQGLGVDVPGKAPARSLKKIDTALDGLRAGASSGRALSSHDLASNCSLSPLDIDILLLSVGAEIDLRFQQLIGCFEFVPSDSPTIGLAAEIFGDELVGRLAARRRFEAEAPLRRFGLIRLESFDEAEEDSSLSDSAYLAAPRAIDFLLSRRSMDSYIRGYARLSEPSVTWQSLHMPRGLLKSIHELLDAGAGRWWDGRQLEARGGLLLLVSGRSGSGRQALGEAVAAQLGRQVLVVNTRLLCSEGRDFKLYVRRILREALLQGAMPIFAECQPFVEGESFDEDGFSLLLNGLESFPLPTVICLDRPLAFGRFPPNKLVYRVDLDPPSAPYRQQLWSALLPADGVEDDLDVSHFAKLFNFGGSGIREMLREAANRALTLGGPEAKIGHDDLMVAGREIQSRRMGRYTRKMTPKVDLGDLIVPARVKATLQEVIQTIRYRHIVYSEWGFGEKVSTGKGLCALFSGAPGTGKSMAAQVIARELGMNLFQVNLARVVSKYIGETEENLAKVFEEARESHSILLFDEADALFAKRTKVKSAQDRYANLEVNFLLQEVESFEGMVILTSNLDAMIDRAFKRRLNYRIHFPFPDAVARQGIWQRLIPEQAPLEEGVDFQVLAEDFEFSGGYIKNAVVRAAQVAAEGEGVITQAMFARAAEVEMAETGRLVRETS